MMRTEWRWTALLVVFSCACASPAAREGGVVGTLEETNSRVHEQLSLSALRNGNMRDALASAREAVRAAPQRPEAALVLARALLLSGSSPQAEGAARQALQGRPDWAEAWLLLGEALLDQGHEVAAREAYRAALEHGATEAELVLGALALQDGEEEHATELLVGAAHGDGVRGLGILASHYWLTGRPEQAERLLEEALRTAPGNDAVRWKLDEVRVARGNGAAFRDRLRSERAAGRMPSMKDRLLLAAERLRAGDGERASREYRQLVALLPDHVGVRMALGEALLEQGDPEGAEAAFKAAGRLHPSSRPVLVGIARARLAAGRPKDAISPLLEAVKVAPSHVATRSLLVAASVAAGDLGLARLEAEEVRVLAPGGVLDHACRRMFARIGHASAEKADEVP